MRALILCVLLLSMLVGCSAPRPEEGKAPLVLVTLAPYAHVVKGIAGDLVRVETLIPAGANPHLYEALPQSVEKQQSAALWVYIGESFDRKLLQFLRETDRGIKTLDVAEGLPLLPVAGGCCEGHDLHIWLSPELMKGQARLIAAALQQILPGHEEELTAGLGRVLKELEEVQVAVTEKVISGDVLLVSHPAFGYFCQEFGLEQRSVEIAGKEPSPREVADLLAYAVAKRARTLLVEPQHSSKGAEIIAAELGIPTHLIDPYAENYPALMRQLAELLAP